jgi:hypothetical protein
VNLRELAQIVNNSLSEYGGDAEVNVASYFETHDGHELRLRPIEYVYDGLYFEGTVNPPSMGESNVFVLQVD